MSADQEMTAARACGVSLYRLAVPVMAMALVVYAISSWFAFVVRPWANTNLEQQLYELGRTRSSAGIREKVFNRHIPGMVVYVDHLSASDSSLNGVLISDSRDPSQQNTIVARSGLLIPDEKQKAVTLRLFDGSVFGQDLQNHASHVTSFRSYDLTIRPQDELGISQHDPEEMRLGELRNAIAMGRATGHRDYQAEAEFARKFTVPVATLLFALIGMSLGLKPARGGQSERFGVSVALFFFYYLFMRLGQTLAERGSLNAFIAMSIPDVVFAVLAVRAFSWREQ
jgi:LPS export ABC transporter permease LptF